MWYLYISISDFWAETLLNMLFSFVSFCREVSVYHNIVIIEYALSSNFQPRPNLKKNALQTVQYFTSYLAMKNSILGEFH